MTAGANIVRIRFFSMLAWESQKTAIYSGKIEKISSLD